MKQIAKHKTTLCTNYEFQKIARYIELENFWNRVFIIVLLFETNHFFLFIWWIKNASNVLTNYYSNVRANAMKKL